jgi:hypothetical protein
MADNRIGVARLDLPERLPARSYAEILALGRASEARGASNSL